IIVIIIVINVVIMFIWRPFPFSRVFYIPILNRAVSIINFNIFINIINIISIIIISTVYNTPHFLLFTSHSAGSIPGSLLFFISFLLPFLCEYLRSGGGRRRDVGEVQCVIFAACDDQ